MGLMWVVNTVMLVAFSLMLLGMVIGIAYIIMIPLLYLLPKSDTDSYIHLGSIDDLPRNIKSKTTTKARWAQRSQHVDDSFANGIMWADLGND